MHLVYLVYEVNVGFFFFLLKLCVSGRFDTNAWPMSGYSFDTYHRTCTPKHYAPAS